MRDIKFRAWNADYNWFESDFECFVGQDGTPYIRTFDTPDTEIEENPNIELSQYTGLKDKNGVDTYEGDILECDAGIYWIVKFINGCFCACDPNEDENFVFLDDYNFKVIGNIYENPELLESK